MVRTTDIADAINAVLKFRDERNWKQFHNSKDLAVAISVEVAELLECFLWKQPEEVNVEHLSEELADVFAYSILLAKKLRLDINEIVIDKMRKNAVKYPIELARDISKKYTEL